MTAPNSEIYSSAMQGTTSKGNRPTTISLLLPRSTRKKHTAQRMRNTACSRNTQLQNIGPAATTNEITPHKENTPWKGGTFCSKDHTQQGSRERIQLQRSCPLSTRAKGENALSLKFYKMKSLSL
jgi:hypothetical protein